MALTEEGDIYTWGKGDCLKLPENVKLPSLIDAVEPNKVERSEIKNFSTKNKFFENQEEVPIKFVKISSNYNHSGAIDHMGNLWTWGNNSDYVH